MQAARENEAATEAAVTEIEGILGELQSQAAELEREAQLKGEAYNVALAALDAAQAKSDRLAEQADAAERRAGESGRKAGQLAAQLGRTGGGSLTLALLLSSDAGDLLDQLGTMTQVSAQAAAIYRLALVDQNTAEAVTAQAEVAEAERDELEDEAGAALDAAQSAADDVNARLAEQQAASDQLYEQLAVLKGTTAEVEQGYLGRTRRAASRVAAAEQSAARSAAARRSGGAAGLEPRGRGDRVRLRAARRRLRVGRIRARRVGLLRPHPGRIRLRRRLHRRAPGVEPVLHDGEPGPAGLVREHGARAT